MRILVACSECSRRYNVAGRPPGAQFRCLCGHRLAVPEGRPHDAAVVRCSSCGAPREQQSVACRHCGSDFTLHERDLHTVCPTCLARVSDRGRYCHFCATPLHAEDLPADATEVSCPACEAQAPLNSRRFPGFNVAVLECSLCAGLWLGLESLEELLAAEARAVSSVSHHPNEAPIEVPRTKRGYIACVVCQQLMSRRNLAQGRTGIVVDVCGAHGVWFDAHELSALIASVRTGSLEDVQLDLARLTGSRDTARRRRLRAEARNAMDDRKLLDRKGLYVDRTPDTFERQFDWLLLAGKLAARLLIR